MRSARVMDHLYALWSAAGLSYHIQVEKNRIPPYYFAHTLQQHAKEMKAELTYAFIDEVKALAKQGHLRYHPAVDHLPEVVGFVGKKDVLYCADTFGFT